MMDMSMTMTFTPWTDYKLKIVFDSWNVTTKGGFALSWFFVVGLTIAYQALKHYLERMDMMGDCFVKHGSMEASLIHNVGKDAGAGLAGISSAVASKAYSPKFLVYHGCLVGLLYGLSLLLMLIAMTYNPWLFLALMIGYGIGDGLFYSRAQAMRKNLGGGAGGYGDCH